MLERAAGAHIHNANTVHPEWQDLRVGDTIWLARRYGDVARQVVAAVEPKSYLVLVSAADFDRLSRGEKASGVWAFYLRRENGWTRLLVRGSGGAVGHAVFDIPHFVVMEQKMMRGIRDRAQKTHRDETEDLLATPVRRRPDETRPTGPSTNPKMMVSWLSVRACTGPELPDARIGGVQAAGVRVTL